MRSFIYIISLLSTSALCHVDPFKGLIVTHDHTIQARTLATPLPSITKCNLDNCLRVMTNTPSVASSFCTTFIEVTTVTTITPTITISGGSTITPAPVATIPTHIVPSHISSQCVLTTMGPLANRLSSACSCLSIQPRTVTSTAIAAATTTTIATATYACDGVNSPFQPTDPNAPTYDIICGSFYQVSSLGDDNTVASFADCMNSCSTMEGCVAVVWVTPNYYFDGSVSTCVYASSYNLEYSVPYYDMAILSNGVGNTWSD